MIQRPPYEKVLRDRTTRPHRSPVLHILSNNDVCLVIIMQVTMGQATLHMKITLGKLLQCGPPKYLNPRDTTGRYCRNAFNKRKKKPHKVDCGRTNLLSGRSPSRLPPWRPKLLPDHLERGGGRDLSSAGNGAALTDPKLTNNVTADIKSDTPESLRGGNQISNLSLKTGL